jgi:hypothetical protein
VCFYLLPLLFNEIKTTIWEHSEGSLGMQHSRSCEEHSRGSRWAQVGSWGKCSTSRAAKGVDLTVEKYYYWILGVNNEIVNKYLWKFHESP